MVKSYVAVPEYITVHLGAPDSYAENVTVSFPEYIKNVASSEIYPTWPESSIRANIYAQVTFALNRVFTEWYRSRGYPFDITSSTSYDQKFIKGRNIFANISDITDEIFNRYIVKRGYMNPYYTEYCNGSTVTCAGLSQWGTVELANRGYTPYEILKYYYGSDIDIKAAPILPYVESYGGVPIKKGSRGHDVELIQRAINRIARNYPQIPIIYPVDGLYGEQTEKSVRTFQQIFGLEADGIVGNATWYKLSFIYSSVRKLAELYGEGILLSDIPMQYVSPLKVGSTGDKVTLLQYFISVIAKFYESIWEVPVSGNFREDTRDQVLNFQRTFGIEVDGIVGRETWNALYEAYLGILNTVPQKYFNETVNIPNIGQYPGYVIKKD